MRTINEERRAAIAFILDRVEQFEATSTNRAFACELVAGLAEGRHVECARAGEYKALRPRVRSIMKAHAPASSQQRAPKLRAVR